MIRGRGSRAMLALRPRAMAMACFDDWFVSWLLLLLLLLMSRLFFRFRLALYLVSKRIFLHRLLLFYCPLSVCISFYFPHLILISLSLSSLALASASVCFCSIIWKPLWLAHLGFLMRLFPIARLFHLISLHTHVQSCNTLIFAESDLHTS